MQTLPRSGVQVPSADRSDSFDPVRDLRAIANAFEVGALLYAGDGLVGARPAAGKKGRIWRSTNKAAGILDYDTGTAWVEIGTQAQSDPAAGVAGLRTLGGGATQAAPGNHSHPERRVLSKANTNSAVVLGPVTFTGGLDDADSAWAQILAATPEEYVITGMAATMQAEESFGANFFGAGLLQVTLGVGGSGAETAVAAAVVGSFTTLNTDVYRVRASGNFIVPQRITAGTRLSVRAGTRASDAAHNAYTFKVLLMASRWAAIEGN